jgi:hypothetical protein
MPYRRTDSHAAVEACKAAIFMIGEISRLGFAIEEEEAHKFQIKQAKEQPLYATSESGGFRVVIPAEIETLVKSLMAVHLSRPTFAQPQTQAGSQTDGLCEDNCLCSVDVRAFAFVSMGKLCLRNKQLAHDMVNVYLRELSPIKSSSTDSATLATSPALRSNALLVLGDLCVRYTQLIDRNVGQMAVCLHDDSVLVRKHTLILLTQLLLQDYLKWRGMLLFRFLALVVDESAELADFARIILRKTFMSATGSNSQSPSYGYGPRNGAPDFFCQHFAECVIVFNNWSDHPSYLAANLAGSEV